MDGGEKDEEEETNDILDPVDILELFLEENQEWDLRMRNVEVEEVIEKNSSQRKISGWIQRSEIKKVIPKSDSESKYEGKEKVKPLV